MENSITLEYKVPKSLGCDVSEEHKSKVIEKLMESEESKKDYVMSYSGCDTLIYVNGILSPVISDVKFEQSLGKKKVKGSVTKQMFEDTLEHGLTEEVLKQKKNTIALLMVPNESPAKNKLVSCLKYEITGVKFKTRKMNVSIDDISLEEVIEFEAKDVSPQYFKVEWSDKAKSFFQEVEKNI